MSAYKDTRRANDMLRAQIEADQSRQDAFRDEFIAARNELKKLDPENWESWWDSYPDMQLKDWLPILKERVVELKNKIPKKENEQ